MSDRGGRPAAPRRGPSSGDRSPPGAGRRAAVADPAPGRRRPGAGGTRTSSPASCSRAGRRHSTVRLRETMRYAGPRSRLYLDLLAPAARYLGELGPRTCATSPTSPSGWGGCSACCASSARRSARPTRGPGPTATASCCCPARASSTPWPGDGRRVLPSRRLGSERRRLDHRGGRRHAGRRANRTTSSASPSAPRVHLESLAGSIRAVREATCNPKIVVLVGGPLFGEAPRATCGGSVPTAAPRCAAGAAPGAEPGGACSPGPLSRAAATFRQVRRTPRHPTRPRGPTLF